VKLQDLLSEPERKSTTILGVSPDNAADIERIGEKILAKSPGPLRTLFLSDPELAVIKRYGLFNETSAGSKRPVPHPTTYVIDREGVVRWKFTEVNYRVRPTNEMVIEALRQVR
jgi:peroxiredoxin